MGRPQRLIPRNAATAPLLAGLLASSTAASLAVAGLAAQLYGRAGGERSLSGLAEDAGSGGPALLAFALLVGPVQALAAFWWSLRLTGRTEARLASALERARAEHAALRRDLDRRVAERTREAEAESRAKSAFLANMSHEIRTPLTAVIGFSALLKDRPGLDAETRRYAQRIDAAGRSLLGLINDILDFSKLEAGEMQLHPRPTDVAALARETLELFLGQTAGKGLGLEFINDLPPQARLLDPQALRQILSNLIGNAVKFTTAGQVSLALAETDDGRISLSVTDTGPGLSEAQQTRLFQRFAQADDPAARAAGGTGLGLSLSRVLADLMGGEITVRSASGQGATFTLLLPAPLAGAAEDEAPSAHAPPALEGVRVLVADDNPANLELVQVILEALGVRVSTARDGAEAAEQALTQTFDLVLMDLRMPGMDGHAALAAIRGLPGPSQRSPVLAFSADVGEDLDLTAFDGVVPKPLTPETLAACVAAALRRG